MTQPPDPNAPLPGATPKETAAAFAERMKIASYQDFGSSYRPAFAHALATGAATPDQIASITSFVRALDVAKQARANAVAGVSVEHSAEQQDLLNSVGEDPYIVKRANSTAQDTKVPSATEQWFNAVGQNIATYSANSGDVIFPQPASFAGKGKTPSGSDENPITHFLKAGLNQVANFSGWLYRSAKEGAADNAVAATALLADDKAAKAAADKLGLTQLHSAQKALGYDPNNPLSDLAFQWNHGEANFNDLSSVVQTYGQEHVNDALNVFYKMRGYGSDFNTALGSYMQDLAQQVRDGKLTTDQYVAKQQFIDSKEFQDVYKAVDMQHSSFGRDMAHLILPRGAQTVQDSAMFDFVSGTGDAAFALAADPTIVGGKLLKSAQLAKYGVDAMSYTKVSRLLGITDKVTGEENAATRLGGRVEGFLTSADKLRELSASGKAEDTVAAAALHARMSRTYNDLMPMLHEVNGNRLAITPEQVAAAKAAGTKATILGTEMDVIKTDPIKTLEDFRDMLIGPQGGLNRYARGAGAGTLKMMPGKVGIISRTLSKAAGANAARRVGAHEGVVLDYLKDADKIIPSDWSELFQKIAQTRGTAQFDALQGQLGLARRMKAGAEQMNRRITSLLPFTKTIAFNSVDAGANVERLARLSLPKYEASILRYIWDTAPTEATRRAIGRGIVNAVHEAAGTTRSVLGRDMLDNWNNGMDQLANRRYGYGETDRLVRADGSIGRAALHLSQIETHLTLPSFEDIRRVASKAAIFGYDRRLADGTVGEGMAGWFTDAAGSKDVAGGLARMVIHPWRTAKYGLFFSKPVERAMSVLKIGWLLTTSNMLRQMSEEYFGIGAAGKRSVLRDGKRYLRLDNDTNRFLIMAHNHLPSFRRSFVVTEDDAARELADSKWRMAVGDGEIVAPERIALDELAEIHEKPAVREMYGARQAGMADGIDVAIAGHADGVQHAPVKWKVAPSHPAKFKGYNEVELNGDSGRAALSDNYGQRFHDEDEPARRALAYLVWNKAAESPKFLKELQENPKLMELMEQLHPADYAHEGSTYEKMMADAPLQEFDKNGELTHDVRVKKQGKGLRLVHRDEATGQRTEEKLQYVYRVVSKDDYARMESEGVLNTNGRSAHGRYDDPEGLDRPQMFAAATPTRLANNYADVGRGSVLLKIKYKPEDGWYKELRDGQESYVATRQALPFDRVESAAPFKATYDEYAEKTTAAGTDGKLLGASTGPLKDYVANDPRMGVFRQRAERLNTDQYGKVIQPGDDASKAEAVEDYVHNLIGDTAAAVYRQDGKSMHIPLVSDLLRGKIPSPEELKKFSITNLPAHVIKAEFEPAPIGKFGQFGQGFTQLLSSGFDKLVTNPMYRLVRKPLFTANYVQARVALMPWERQLVEEFGWKAEEAKRVVSGIAEGQAMQDTIKYIDNPAMRSQFSVIAQNVWLFYRAQEDWARRWARILKENPEAIRKAHMAIMAGTQTGMIDKDSDGNLIFSYPGSGLAIEAMMHVGALLGMGGPKIPHVDDLTSQVNYLNPALMNPIGFSASPALSVPFDLLAKFIPGGEMLKSQADMAMEGQLGNGRAWWEQFAPTAVRRLLQLTPIDGSADNTGSTVGSSAATAVQNAALLGQLPTDTSDAVQVQKFITDTQTQTMNALVARSLFAFFAPGAPSMPELYGQEPADFSWRAAGVRTLKDEYQAMVQSFGFEKALVMWQELHPDKLIYTVGKTDAAAKGASIDPTFGSIQWIQAHKDLFDGPYKRVAAYFVPPAPGNFDQAGWNAMLAIGVRQHKDLAEYYTDLVSKAAVSDWFTAKDDYDAATAAARSGDLGQLEREWSKENLSDARKAQLRQIFSNTQNAGLTTKAIDAAYQQKKDSLYAQYPILHPYFNQTAARKDDTRQIVNELTQMVKDPTVTDLPDLPGVAQMLTVKDNYERQLAPLNGQRSTLAATTRQDLRNAYDDDMKRVVGQFPNLQDLYNGVFRYLEFS